MIKREFFKERKDGVKLYITYSDEEYMIRQVETGNIYDTAIDVENSPYSYEETNEKIKVEEETEDGIDNNISN